MFEFATGLFDLLYSPLLVLGEFGALAVVSGATGVLMLWVYKHASNQEAIRLHKDHVFGNLIGVRLFQNDLGVFFKLQGRIFVSALRYASHSLKPLCIVIVPFVLMLIQLDWRHGARGFEPGEAALVKVTVDSEEALEAVSLTTTEGIDRETAAIRIPSKREVVWRIRASEAGVYDVRVEVNGTVLTKRVVVGATTEVDPGCTHR